MEQSRAPAARFNRKSAFIRLGLTTAMALSIRCGGPMRQAQRCVDDYGRVVEDRYCDQPTATAPHPYHWYYGGSGYYPGQTASGGSTTPSAGATSVRTSSPGFDAGSVSRGGFGATGEGGGE